MRFVSLSKSRRLRFSKPATMCHSDGNTKQGYSSLLDRQHCQLLLAPRHYRTRQIAISPALVNVIVPAIGSISEIEKSCIRCRHILAMAGSLSLSSVVCKAGTGSSTVKDLLADPRRFVSRIRRDGLYLRGVLDQVSEKRVKCSAVVDVARCHLRLHPRLSQMVCASYHASPSMSSPGCPYDNATVENFLGALKTECLYRPASPHAPRWNSPLPSTSIFIILNVSRSKTALPRLKFGTGLCKTCSFQCQDFSFPVRTLENIPEFTVAVFLSKLIFEGLVIWNPGFPDIRRRIWISGPRFCR